MIPSVFRLAWLPFNFIFAPNLLETGEISTLSETAETEASHSRTTQEPVRLLGARGEVVITDSPIATLTSHFIFITRQ